LKQKTFLDEIKGKSVENIVKKIESRCGEAILYRKIGNKVKKYPDYVIQKAIKDLPFHINQLSDEGKKHSDKFLCVYVDIALKRASEGFRRREGMDRGMNYQI